MTEYHLGEINERRKRHRHYAYDCTFHVPGDVLRLFKEPSEAGFGLGSFLFSRTERS